jgi:hypothetical protein
MPSVKTAFLWAMQLFLYNDYLEVIGWGPNGPVVIDRDTRQEVTQSKDATNADAVSAGTPAGDLDSPAVSRFRRRVTGNADTGRMQ